MFTESPLRAHNPFSPVFARSTCVFRYGTKSGEHTRVEEMRLGHQRIDAFGGLLQLRTMAQTLGLEFASVFAEMTEGECDGYHWRHVWRHVEATSSAAQTFTQQFITALLTQTAGDFAHTLSLAVAVDDLKSIPALGPWGNSLALVHLPREEALASAGLDKASWTNGLGERARRMVNALALRPNGGSRHNPNLLISSIGRLERLGWAPALDPSSLMMVPTPGRADLATLILWSAHQKQALTVAAHPGHPLLDHHDAIVALWKGLL